MKALILAAGQGLRLKELTKTNPKALVSVKGKAILHYQLQAMAECGVCDIGMVVGRHGQNIIDFVGKNFSQMRVKYYWNPEYETSNSSYSFWLARDWVKGDSYLHFNCDIIFSPSLLKRLLSSREKNVIAVRRDVTLSDHMENVSLEGNKIVKMSIAHFPEAKAKAFGMAKFSPESTELLSTLIEGHLKAGDKNQNFYGLIRKSLDWLDYYALEAGNDILLEINSLKDREEAENFLS